MGINKFETLLKLVEAMNLSLTYGEECLGRVMLISIENYGYKLYCQNGVKDIVINDTYNIDITRNGTLSYAVTLNSGGDIKRIFFM